MTVAYGRSTTPAVSDGVTDDSSFAARDPSVVELPAGRRRRRTPAQIVAVLQQADALLTRGEPVAAVIAAIGVSEATFHRWRAHYGGIKAEDARRLRELELENRDLKSQVANQCLDILLLRQALSVDVLGPRLRATIVGALQARFGVSERRACEVIGQSRSSQRRMSELAVPDAMADPADDELDFDALAVAYPDLSTPPPPGPA